MKINSNGLAEAAEENGDQESLHGGWSLQPGWLTDTGVLCCSCCLSMFVPLPLNDVICSSCCFDQSHFAIQINEKCIVFRG